MLSFVWHALIIENLDECLDAPLSQNFKPRSNLSTWGTLMDFAKYFMHMAKCL